MNYSSQGRHVVIDDRDGAIFGKDARGQDFTAASALAFAGQRNAGLKPEHRSYSVYQLGRVGRPETAPADPAGEIPPHATLSDRRALCGADVTIDGMPGVIGNAAGRFAQVAALHIGGPVAEYAWPTVARVVAAGGAFKS